MEKEQLVAYLSNVANVEGLISVFSKRRDAALKSSNIPNYDVMNALRNEINRLEQRQNTIKERYKDTVINPDTLDVKPLQPNERGLPSHYTEEFFRLLQRKSELLNRIEPITIAIKSLTLLEQLQTALTDLKNKNKIIADAYRNSAMSRRLGEGDAEVNEAEIETTLKSNIQIKIENCLKDQDIKKAVTNIIVATRATTNYRQ